MYTAHPTIDALLDADPRGWASAQSQGILSCWKHANGLHMSMDPRYGSYWSLNLTFGDATLAISLPKSAGPTEGSFFDHLVHDLQLWRDALDVAPRRRITQQLSAWLSLCGKTGTYEVGVSEMNKTRITVNPEIPLGYLTWIQIPVALVQAMQADIDDLWKLSPTPDGNMPERRRWWMPLPSTHHAKMELMQALTPEMRAVPWPTRQS